MRKSCLHVFFLCLVVYLINGRPHPEVDCVAGPYTAWSMVKHGSYELQHYPALEEYVNGVILTRADGAWVSMRPPGTSIVALPIIAPIALFRDKPLRPHDMHHVGKLVAGLCVAGAAVFFFLICARLAPGSEWPATLLFGLGTCLASVASQALWLHGPAVFWLCCALYCLTHSDGDTWGYRVVTGLALGMAVLTRPTTAFFVLATLGVLLAQRRWRAFLPLALGGLVPALVLFHYNWSNFGDLLLGGYKDDKWTVSPPLWLGLGGLLVAPSRGVLVYSPALLLVVPGVWMLCRRDSESPITERSLLIGWFGAAVVTLFFYARWHDWRGGWCYGPRFLCEAMPILCLLFGLAYSALRTPVQRGFAKALVGLSIAVHCIGLFGYSGYEDWHHRHAQQDQVRSLFALNDTQIEAHARAFLRKLTR